MKIIFVAIGLIITTACHSNNNGGSNADSTKTPGNSAGATTISADNYSHGYKLRANND